MVDRSDRFLAVKIQNVELKANNMFRFSLIVCAALIFGVTAKPYKPLNKLEDEAYQIAVMSIDDKGKMSWGMEVEPPEDMDKTGFNIDPRMRIWKSMTEGGQDKLYQTAEEDLDELYHPSMIDLQNQDAQAEPSQEEANMKDNRAPEEDRDDIDHPVFSEVDPPEPEQDWDDVYHKEREEVLVYLAPMMAVYEDGAEVQVGYSEPEEDEDELYHKDEQLLPVQTEMLKREVRGASVRMHLQPEEDFDDLYHKDVLPPVPYQGETEAAAPKDVPFQRKHSEPEEDLDDLYHQ